MFFGNAGDHIEIAYGQKRIGRSFDEDGRGRGTYGLLKSICILGIDYTVSKSEIIEDLVQYPECSAVHILRNKDLISRLKQKQRSADRSHSGCKGKACVAVLKLGDELFKGGARRITGTRVFPLRLTVDLLLLEGRGLIDGYVDRTCQGIAVYSAVDQGRIDIFIG